MIFAPHQSNYFGQLNYTGGVGCQCIQSNLFCGAQLLSGDTSYKRLFPCPTRLHSAREATKKHPPSTGASCPEKKQVLRLFYVLTCPVCRLLCCGAGGCGFAGSSLGRSGLAGSLRRSSNAGSSLGRGSRRSGGRRSGAAAGGQADSQGTDNSDLGELFHSCIFLSENQNRYRAPAGRTGHRMLLYTF